MLVRPENLKANVKRKEASKPHWGVNGGLSIIFQAMFVEYSY